jgi:signal peptidase I
MTSATPFRKSTLREYFESIVIAVILALFIRTWIVQAFKIPTGSMEQNLVIGDHLLVNKFVFGPAPTSLERVLAPTTAVRRGDILVFKYPQEPARDFIKRVIGLPGETLEVRQKQLYIDGVKLEEPYLQGQMPMLEPGVITLDRRDNFGPVAIPDGHYFMMGDNRDNSEDSRFWGTLPHAYVKGKAMIIYWSLEAPRPLVPDTSPGATVRRVGSIFLHFFSGTRWSRMFQQVT